MENIRLKRLGLMIALGGLMGFIVKFALGDFVPNVFNLLSRNKNSVISQNNRPVANDGTGGEQPPCYMKPSTTSTILIYRKASGNAQAPVIGSHVFVQTLGGGGFSTIKAGVTNDFGKAIVDTVIGKDNKASRVIAVSPDLSDTTIVYLQSCSGVKEIHIPVTTN